MSHPVFPYWNRPYDLNPYRSCVADGERRTVWMSCTTCGSEGRLYFGHPNDPNPRDGGECPVCEGTGMEDIPTDPIELEDLVPLVPA